MSKDGNREGINHGVGNILFPTPFLFYFFRVIYFFRVNTQTLMYGYIKLGDLSKAFDFVNQVNQNY